MRIIFFILLAANVVLLAYGQGFFGPPPSEQGRNFQVLLDQRNEHAVIPGTPQ
ncbi:MAG TPA: hypothetical protein VK062_03705 [Burkholderiaceae bacterium]|nr:hypothetical protein [Burkholderiaceae bacterium]